MKDSEVQLEIKDSEARLEILEPSPWRVGVITETYVVCPKHGTHRHTIASNIKGHEGTWCMICALEKLGEPLETEQRPFEWERE